MMDINQENHKCNTIVRTLKGIAAGYFHLDFHGSLFPWLRGSLSTPIEPGFSHHFLFQ